MQYIPGLISQNKLLYGSISNCSLANNENSKYLFSTNLIINIEISE